jgi:hypothetical protein
MLQDLLSLFQVIAAVLVLTATAIRYLSRLVTWIMPKTARECRFTVELGDVRVAVVITIGSWPQRPQPLPRGEGDDHGQHPTHDR